MLKGNEFDINETGGVPWADLPVVARSVGRAYEAFAKSGSAEQACGDWELALHRHEFVERMFEKGGM